MSAKRAWVVLPDLLSIRVFVDTGILSGLRERLDGELEAVYLVPWADAAEWAERDAVTRARRRRPDGSDRPGRPGRWAGSTRGSTGGSATTRSRSA